MAVDWNNEMRLAIECERTRTESPSEMAARREADRFLEEVAAFLHKICGVPEVMRVFGTAVMQDGRMSKDLMSKVSLGDLSEKDAVFTAVLRYRLDVDGTPEFAMSVYAKARMEPDRQLEQIPIQGKWEANLGGASTEEVIEQMGRALVSFTASLTLKSPALR